MEASSKSIDAELKIKCCYLRNREMGNFMFVKREIVQFNPLFQYSFVTPVLGECLTYDNNQLSDL